MKYLDTNGIRNAFAKHLIEHRGYTKDEAAMATFDFPDPYNLPYLCEEYVGEEMIDGINYEKDACYTELWRCGISDVPMFRFYTYYAIDDIPNHQVGEYMEARKIYQVDDLDEEDFPSEDDEEEDSSMSFFF
jgi:hypothetical protein